MRNKTTDYDMSIHSNPDAQAWAKFYKETFPEADEEAQCGGPQEACGITGCAECGAQNELAKLKDKVQTLEAESEVLHARISALVIMNDEAIAKEDGLTDKVTELEAELEQVNQKHKNIIRIHAKHFKGKLADSRKVIQVLAKKFLQRRGFSRPTSDHIAFEIQWAEEQVKEGKQ